MSELAPEVTRRTLSKMLLALPAAAILPADGSDERKKEEKPSAQAEFIAAQESGLSPEARERLKKNITGGERSLAVIRDFRLPMDVGPALRFRPLKSRRS